MDKVKLHSYKPIEDGLSIEIHIPENTLPVLVQEKVSLIEFYKRQLDLIITAPLKSLETKKYLLAFIKVYGSTYKDKVVESRICTSKDSLNNYEKDLRQDNLLIGYWPDAVINPDIDSQLHSKPLVVMHHLSIDDSSEILSHKNYKRF